jgi:hypothetical protein
LNLMMNITNCNVITFSFRLKKCWSKKQPLWIFKLLSLCVATFTASFMTYKRFSI